MKRKILCLAVLLLCCASWGGVLTEAIKTGDVARAENLLASRSDMNVNERDEQQRTALMWAAKQGQYEIVRRLLARKARVNLRDKDGHTALYFAIQNRHREVAELLLTHGANPNIPDKEGSVVLMNAIVNKDKAMMELLLNVKKNKKQIPVNANQRMYLKGVTPEEKVSVVTPLYFSVVMEYEDGVRVLLKNGADINAPGWGDETALAAATGESLENMTRLLLANGADPNRSSLTLVCPSCRGKLNIVRMLVKAGANINMSDPRDKQTGLMCAARNGNMNMVRFHLENGANVHLKDKEGKTALALALEKGHQDVAALLRRYGATN